MSEDNIVYNKIYTLDDTTINEEHKHQVIESSIKNNLVKNNKTEYSYSVQYWVDNKHANIVYFVSEHYSEALMAALTEYIANGMKQYINRSDDFYKDYTISIFSKLPEMFDTACQEFVEKNNKKHINKFVEENLDSTYDDKMIVAFLSILSAYNVTSKLDDKSYYEKLDYYVNKQLDHFSQKSNKIDTIEDFCKYFVPTMIDLSDDKLDFAANAIASSIMLINTDEMIDFWYRIYLIKRGFESIENIANTNIMDLDTTHHKKDPYDSSFLKINFMGDFNNPWFESNIEHVKTLTAQEFLKVHNNSTIHMEPEMFKQSVSIILHPNAASKKIEECLNKIDNNKHDFDAVKDMINYINNDYDDYRIYFLPLYNDFYMYFIKHVVDNPSELNDELINDVLDFIKSNEFAHIVRNDDGQISSSSQLLLNKLVTTFGFKETVSILKDLKTIDIYLDTEEWNEFLTNYEDNKELPVAWQVELVKN